MIYRYAITLILFAAIQFNAFAQRDSISLNALIEKASKYSSGTPIEKVYLHFDKPYYAVDDTMWFKGYVSDSFHQPSQLSKVLYVELMNSRDSLVQMLKLLVKNGVTTGSFPLPEGSFRQDNYHIRAYTKWMANFEPAYFFSKSIPVGNAIDKLVNTHVTFTKTGTDKSLQVTTRVVYKDNDNNPIANKKVTWEISSSSDDIAKGKGNTDANGALNISFTNSKQVDLTGANIVAIIDLGNRKTAGRTISLKPVLGTGDVQFFPEGGDLLNGVRSRVAVKALGSNGLGMNFTGTITDNAGTVVTNVSSQHAGMGMFVITPESGKTYKASINFSNGTKGSFDLPKAQTTGFNLSITNIEADNLGIKLSASQSFYEANKGRAFYIVAQSVGTVCFAAQTFLKDQIYSATVAKSKFPTGIVQFTLMSSTGIPLSERIVFVQRNDQMNITMSSDKPAYGVRQRVKLNIMAKSKNAPVEGDFSVSVVDESKVAADEDAEITIMSGLLLTSDLKGYVEKPNYYFSKINDKTAADLDLLMLSQGYRRFSYADVAANKRPQILYLPEQGIEVTGTLRTLNGMPFKGGNVRLLIPNRYFSANAVSDPEGRFKFPNLVFTDTTKLVATAKNNYNSKNLMLMVDGPTYPALPKNQLYPDEEANIDSTMRPYLLNSKKQMNSMHILKEVVVKAPQAKGPSHTDYPALTGLSMMADHTLSPEMFKNCGSLLICIQSMMMGVTFDNNQFFVTRDYNQGKRVPMSVFVRGMPVDVSYLASLTGAEVESIEIFLRDELGLVNNAYQTNGVIVINTKVAPKGTKISVQDLQDLLPQPAVVNFVPKGYNITREFYSPKYDVPKPVGVDLRSTLYWNPRVSTDKSGAASLEFYNADGKGSFRAIIEGWDKDGNLGRFIYRYRVQ